MFIPPETGYRFPNEWIVAWIIIIAIICAVFIFGPPIPH